MTVLDLIEDLQKMDADAPVVLSATEIGWEPVEDGRVILSMD